MFSFKKTKTITTVNPEAIIETDDGLKTIEEIQREIFIMDGEKISNMAETIFIDLVNDEENRANLSPSDLAESAFEYAKAYVKVYNKFWDIRNKAAGQ